MRTSSLIVIIILCWTRAGFAQNVGIGTSNPVRAKLEVHGAVEATSAIFGGESSGVSLQRNWPGIGFNTYYGNSSHRYLAKGHGGLFSLDPINGFMLLDMFGPGQAALNVTFPNRAMVVSKEGWVSIGTPQAPTASLRVGRGVSFDGTARLEGSHHHSFFNKGTDEHTYIRAGKDGGIVVLNDIPGGEVIIYNVGINSGNVYGHPLEITQTNNKALLINNAGNTWGQTVEYDFFTLKFNGAYKGEFSYTDGQYAALSDRRLKTNINALSPVLGKIMQLSPVDYEMIHHNPFHKKSIGFIAQEVRELFPELVNVKTDSTSGYEGISSLHTLNYAGFGVIAIKAIQELKLENEALKKELECLVTESKSNSMRQKELLDLLWTRIETLEAKPTK
jgi:hypothetical protein